MENPSEISGFPTVYSTIHFRKLLMKSFSKCEFKLCYSDKKVCKYIVVVLYIVSSIVYCK